MIQEPGRRTDVTFSGHGFHRPGIPFHDLPGAHLVGQPFEFGRLGRG